MIYTTLLPTSNQPAGTQNALEKLRTIRQDFDRYFATRGLPEADITESRLPHIIADRIKDPCLTENIAEATFLSFVKTIAERLPKLRMGAIDFQSPSPEQLTKLHAIAIELYVPPNKVLMVTNSFIDFLQNPVNSAPSTYLKLLKPAK